MNEIEIFLSFIVLLLLIAVICLNGRCNEFNKEIEDLKWNFKRGNKND